MSEKEQIDKATDAMEAILEFVGIKKTEISRVVGLMKLIDKYEQASKEISTPTDREEKTHE